MVESTLQAQLGPGSAFATRIAAQPKNAPLYRGSTTGLGLFVNADAQYLNAFLERSSNKVYKYVGAVPTPAATGETYFSIMAVNHDTTATVDATDVFGLGGWGASYTLFAATDAAQAALGGYNSADASHHLLQFGAGNTFPGIVVRTINPSCALPGGCKGFATTTAASAAGPVDAATCRAAMGAAYPELTVVSV